MTMTPDMNGPEMTITRNAKRLDLMSPRTGAMTMEKRKKDATRKMCAV